MAQLGRHPGAGRTVAALALLALAVAVFVSLGRWQLGRAHERRAIAQAIEAGRAQAPLALSPEVDAGELRPWRAARASGRWRHELSVLVDNRNLDGRPGLWLATPLEFDGGRGQAVLVLRGWMARPLGGEPLPAVPRPQGRQTVEGELAARVPRMFELPGAHSELPQGWPGPAAPDGLPRVQNLDLDALARASGLALLPAVLMQTSPAGDGLARQWPQPSVDADQNVGYALQWFSFAAIAAIAWLAVAARAWRRRASNRIPERRDKTT
ncbi:SURF1 family protein [Orrella sp. JC864]|uniref:SURF1 family protein n=1 Tax=Orrella sp. JC864 TaxID=3120298 RepID=UPI00300846CD